jgi:hypothetical protein
MQRKVSGRRGVKTDRVDSVAIADRLRPARRLPAPR